jgi:hypothetical protein
MTNRTMKQKALKERRQRRAWAKPLAMASGIVPNRGVLGEYKERAAGLGISEYEVDQLIKKLYKRDAIEGIPAGRTEVLALLRELKRQVPEMFFFSIVDTPFWNAICFYNSEKTCYVLALTDLRKHTVRRSIEYGSKERALHVWNHNKVVWVSHKSIRQDASIRSG